MSHGWLFCMGSIVISKGTNTWHSPIIEAHSKISNGSRGNFNVASLTVLNLSSILFFMLMNLFQVWSYINVIIFQAFHNCIPPLCVFLCLWKQSFINILLFTRFRSCDRFFVTGFWEKFFSNRHVACIIHLLHNVDQHEARTFGIENFSLNYEETEYFIIKMYEFCTLIMLSKLSSLLNIIINWMKW